MSSQGIIVAIDADNLLISAVESGQPLTGYTGFETGFENMFGWINTFGKILCCHFYISQFQTQNEAMWNSLWQKYKDDFLLEVIYCPRNLVSRPSEIGQMRPEKPDLVDAHLIEHSRRMVDLYGDCAEYFCLGSGDSDYSPFLWELKRSKGLKIAFAVGSQKSFSRVYQGINVAGKHPQSGNDLIHFFWPRRIKERALC